MPGHGFLRRQAADELCDVFRGGNSLWGQTFAEAVHFFLLALPPAGGNRGRGYAVDADAPSPESVRLLPVMELDTVEAILNSVAFGVGISLLPAGTMAMREAASFFKLPEWIK